METTATPQRNNDVDGDIIVVNDDNTLSNNPTTPVASRTIIHALTTAGTTPEASASMLSPTSISPNSNMMLREWTVTRNNMTQLQALPNISSPIPPVAPAVLLIQREGSSNSTASATVDATRTRSSHCYQYPVATFVTNLVRTVSENVRGEIRDYMPPCNVQRSQISVEAPSPSYATLEAPVSVTTTNCNNNCVNNNNSDVSINNDAVPIIPVAPSQTALSNANTNNNCRNTTNAPLVADFEDSNQEWTMINGEFVSRLDYTEEDLGANESDSCSMRDISRHDIDYIQKRNRHNSKSSRMQRGVRKLKKLKKIFSGGNSIRGGEKKKGDKDKITRGESARRKQRESQEQGRHQQENPKLRSTATDIFSSNRSMLSTASSGSGASLLWKKRHKRTHSSSNASISPQRSRDSISATNSIQNRPSNLSSNDSHSSASRREFPPTPTINGKPAAIDHQRAGRGFMPPVKEISQALFSSSMPRPPPSSLVVESPLHAPPIITDDTGDLLGVPSITSGQNDFQRSTSIATHASFVCHAESVTSEAGVLPDSIAATEYYIEARLDEYDKYDDKSMKSSIKVDKQEGPCIDIMLERAGEIAKDLEASMLDEDAPLKLPPFPTKSAIGKGKSDGESVPLSMASPGDEIVHNDILKLVLVGDNAVDKSGLGRSLRKSTKKPRQRIRLAVDVHTWMPSNAYVRFTIWEVLTSKSEDPYLPNFGARPGTQSLFFSDQSLYLLVYDLGASNPETFRHSNKTNEVDSYDGCSDDEWDEHMNAYLIEEADRKADRALQADIEERVLSWVNCIARRGANSAILPIALIPFDMSPEEAKRRCHIMQTSILNYVQKLPSNIVRPKILCAPETVVCVSLHNDMGLEDLEQMILEIADASHDVFHHVGRPVPPGTVEIMNVCRDLKKTHKMILVDHLIAKLPKKPDFSAEAVMEVLYFLATIGEVLYFGGSDSVLKHYVILSRNWLVGALSCILRNDLQRELSETRQFFKLQSFYSDQEFPESHVTQIFSGTNSSCPILSCQDTQMLWKSSNFMMEAVDQSAQLSENLTIDVFRFLQYLLEHSGVFLPLEIDRFSSTDRIYFVPSLLSQASSRDVWTYKSSESWMVTLCHSWLYRDGAPAGLMEQVTIALLRDLYENSHANAETPTRQVHQSRSNRHLQRAQTFPFGQSSLTNFLDSHDGEPIGQIKIHQINCWKNSLLVKIGRVFPKGNELYESIIEIFVAVTDQVSPHSVASDAMRFNMQRLVVSGKGEVGLHGQKLWKGGYNIVLDSIKASVANYTNVERQVVCPECLAHRPACSANTWSWDSVLAASDHTVRCMMGHRADRHMICGTVPVITKFEDGGKIGNVDKKPVKDLFPSLVIVGLWDNETNTIQNVGSGFITNKKLGLVVTASHILFNMDKGRGFGAPYKGLKNARAIIGVIPSDKNNDTTAVFRYFAKIVADDIQNMDACVLKITSRLENDVHNHALVGEQPERLLKDVQEESLSSLKITSRYEIEQAVRIIGFNQGGEGRLERGNHVNRTSDFALGYICKQFKISDEESSTSSDDSSSSEEGVLLPREEIVVMCNTIEGHSGGPCVNDDGKVVGILSRSDPVDRQRCYLVPSSEIKILISKAKNRVGMGY